MAKRTTTPKVQDRPVNESPFQRKCAEILGADGWNAVKPILDVESAAILVAKCRPPKYARQYDAATAYLLADSAIRTGELPTVGTVREGERELPTVDMDRFIQWADHEVGCPPITQALRGAVARAQMEQNWLTPTEAAVRFYKRVDMGTSDPPASDLKRIRDRIYRACGDGRLACTGNGRTRRIDPQSLERFIVKERRDLANAVDIQTLKSRLPRPRVPVESKLLPGKS